MHQNLELLPPHIRCRESYIEALREYHAEGRFLDVALEDVKKDFVAYVEKEKSKALGRNQRPGYVPETRLWLLVGDEYIGEVGIRHSLTQNLLRVGGHIGYAIRPSKRREGYGKLILELALPKARELGITKSLVTCDSTNIASKRIIERAGGLLENEVPGETESAPTKLRYWIELS